MRNLLADVCPVGDDAEAPASSAEEAAAFPLPDSHWINKPYGTDQKHKTLLHLAIERRMDDMVKALLSAGARADLYNEMTGQG